MNDRYRNERSRGEPDWREHARMSESGWREGGGQPGRAEWREPQYSSDEDETYGSEWARNAGGFDRDRGGGWDDSPRRPSGREESSSRPAMSRAGEGRARGQGHVGHYGSGGRGGYSGGYAGGGFGGSSGTSYERSDANRGEIGGLGPSPGYGSSGYGSSGYGSGGYGQSQGYSGAGGNYGGFGMGGGTERRFGREGSSFGSGRGFGGGLDQGYRGRDFGSPGADLRAGGFAGRGPKGYTRSDDRIREDVCERLSQDDDVDASEIEVSVKGGEVTLRGTVITRSMKHDAEDIAEKVSGVHDVHNELRVMKGMLGELKDKLSGDEPSQHFAGGGTKNVPATAGASRSS